MSAYRRKTDGGRWRQHWYEAVVYIGRDLHEKPLEPLREALRMSPWNDVQSIEVDHATSGGARVVFRLKARHAGEAAVLALDLIATAAPAEWNYAEATVEATRIKEGISRWHRLAVDPVNGEETCANAALWLAGHAANTADPAGVTLEVLQMCGLTLKEKLDG